MKRLVFVLVLLFWCSFTFAGGGTQSLQISGKPPISGGSCDSVEVDWTGTHTSGYEFYEASGAEEVCTKVRNNTGSAFVPCALSMWVQKTDNPTGITLKMQLWDDDGGSGDASRPDWASGADCETETFSVTEFPTSYGEVKKSISGGACPSFADNELKWVCMAGISGAYDENSLHASEFNYATPASDEYELVVNSAHDTYHNTSGNRAIQSRVYGP